MSVTRNDGVVSDSYRILDDQRPIVGNSKFVLNITVTSYMKIKKQYIK